MSLRLFLTALVTVFLSEMGDKTQVTTMLLAAARSKYVWFVALGSATALSTTALLETTAGAWLARRVTTSVIRLVSSLAFLAMGVLLVCGVIGSGGR